MLDSEIDRSTAAGPDPLTAATGFIGRDAELRELEALVAHRRWVTLTGLGGAGKTKLATEFGHRSADGFRFVALDAVTDPMLLPQVTAAAVGRADHLHEDPIGQLVDQLPDGRIAICLDGCEHLRSTTAELAETLQRRCPELTILATSREPLGVPGETVWRVPPMCPDEAVRLFADRARLAAPRFELEPVVDDVRTVCARVGHLPLAIELTAAWVRLLSPAEIAVGLEGASRSLRPAVGWLTRGRGRRSRLRTGWESLSPTEREVVCRVTEGLANPEIASRLYMSRSTVKTHLSHIYAKLGVANRTELATLASRQPS